MFIFGLIVPLLIIGGLAWLITKAFRGGSDDVDGGISVRRFFQFGLLLFAVLLVAIGASGLVANVTASSSVFRSDSSETAQSIAFLVVGAPALYGLVRWIRPTIDAERRSLSWALYLASASITALLTAAFGAFELGLMIFGSMEYDSRALGRFVVWTVVWIIHWRIAAHQPDDEYEALRLHYYIGSFAGLAALATSIGALVGSVATDIYESFFDRSIAEPDDLETALVGLVVGGAMWFVYWFSKTRTFERTTAWYAYTLVAGVVAGLIATITGVAIVLFDVLDWYFGTQDGTAAQHFDGVPLAVATAVTGGALWLYHRAVVAVGGPAARSEASRAHDYLIAAVGLITTAIGIAIVIVAILQTLLDGPPVTRNGSDDLSTLMAAITMLIVGAPLWWRTWSAIRSHRTTAPEAEIRSATRRIYLTALFGIGGVAGLISLLMIVVGVVEDFIDGNFGQLTVYEVRVPIAIVITFGAVAAYHWAVFREDRADDPEDEEDESTTRVRLVVLISSDGTAAARALATETGIRVRVWDDPNGSPAPSVAALQAALETATRPRLLVIARPDGLETIPYTER